METGDTILQAIFDHTALGIAQISLDGSLLRVNDRYCQMLGYSQSEMRGRKVWDVTRPADYDEVSISRRQLLEGAISSHSMEKRYIRKDGTAFWGRLNRSLVRDHDHLPQYFIAVVEDITEKRQAEQARRDSEQHLRLAVSTGVGVWEHDLRSHIPALSPQYDRVFGRSPVTLEEWFKLIHLDDRERVMALIRESIKGLSEWNAEFRLLYPDGSIGWMLSKGTVTLDDDGRPDRMVGVSIDITERKQAEAFRSHLAAIVESSDDAIISKTLDGAIVSWNPGAERIYGYKAEEMLGRTMSLLVPPGGTNEIPHLLGRLRLGESLEHYETTRVRKDGRRIEVSVSISPIRDSTSTVVAGSVIARDVTERKQAEAALRDSEERFRAIFSQAAVGMAQIGLDGEWLVLNDRFCEILGYTQAELRRKTFLDFKHPDDREASLTELRRALTGDISSWSTEERYVRGDGTIVWGRLCLSLVRDHDHLPQYFIAVVEDVTERIQAERAQVEARELLRESEKHLKNAERLAHIGHWHWDIRTNRVSGSEEMFRIFGKPQNSTPSYEGFLQDLMLQDRERVERLISDSLERKVGHSTEYQVAHPNGSLRTISCTWEVLLDGEGLPARLFGTCQDITDSRRAQEESLVRQNLESVGTLASGIAHDFNNLLGAVLAQADLALEEFDAGSSPKEELTAIREVAIRGSEIVRQLMIYAGKENETVGLVDVSQIIKEMLQLLRVSVSKHAVVKTDLGKDLPAVQANAAQLRQIVMNLVTNASDAIGDRDGVIRVTTRRVTLGRDAAIENDYVQLEVSDNGCGMSQEMQARVFDPFFTSKSAGHGLGLAVVHGIVRSLRGSIHVTSEPGKGTTFKVLLPCAEGKAGATSAPMSGAEQSARPPQAFTVLVVEDEDPLRQAVFKTLRQKGFEVFEAATGSAAIDLLRTIGGKIDVMLLDMTIPGASSHEVVAEAAKARPDIKVILTSAYSQEMLTPPLRASQIRGFIRKPFRLDDLVEKLRSASLATDDCQPDTPS